MNKIILYPLIAFSFVFTKSSELYIDYTQLSKININMELNDVLLELGDPILILADSEIDNLTYLFYNYKIKQFNVDNNVVNLNKRNYNSERQTLIKFTFSNNKLESWTEDKITLSSATQPTNIKRSTLMYYFSLLLNMILILKFV